jgi:hypothetical protein
MNISWRGLSCFSISHKFDSNDVTLVTDPYSKEVGLFQQKLEADIVTLSNQGEELSTDKVVGVSGDVEPIYFDIPGEYETKKVFITGVPTVSGEGKESFHNTIFHFDFDDISIVHLGNLKSKLSVEQIDQIGDVDILLIPVGGHNTLNAVEAAEVVRQIEPRIVIPMHYKIDGVKTDLDDESRFIKEMGGKFEKLPRLKIFKKDMPEDMIKVIVLEKE